MSATSNFFFIDCKITVGKNFVFGVFSNSFFKKPDQGNRIRGMYTFIVQFLSFTYYMYRKVIKTSV